MLWLKKENGFVSLFVYHFYFTLFLWTADPVDVLPIDTHFL